MKRFFAWIVAATLLCCLVPTVSVAAASCDLEVIDLSWTGGDGQVKPGTSLQVSATVINSGTADITTPFTVEILRGTTRVMQQTVNNLKAGERIVVVFEPWSAALGDYMLVAQVDGGNTVSESNERNNTHQRNLRVASDRLQPAYASMGEILSKAGMTDLIFNDDFSSASSVDNQKTKAAGYKWYITRPYGAPDLDGGDYTVKNGVMTVHNETPTYNYGLGTTDMDTHVGFTFTTGYLEVKLRIPRPRENTENEKGAPAIWALPTEKLFDGDSAWVELDWMEYWGNNYYTICLHDQIRKGDQVEWSKNSNASFHGLGDGDWHVMGWLWQEGLLVSYMDGEEVMRLTWAENELSWPIQTVNEGTLREGVFSLLDKQHMPIVIGGSQDNPMELDYVRVWDGNTTGTYVPPEKEITPNTTVVLQMAADVFVHNFTTDFYADPIKTVTEENRAEILAGEATWNSLTADRRAEINALLKQNGQPTYEALLAAAKAPQGTRPTAKPTTPAPKPTAPGTGNEELEAPGTGETQPTQPTESESENTLPTTGTTGAIVAQPSKDTNSWLALLGGAIIVVVVIVLLALAAVIGVVVLIVVLVKRKKKSSPPDETAEVAEETPEEQE